MSPSNPSHLPAHAKCSVTTLHLELSTRTQPWHHNSSQLCLQRFHGTLLHGTNVSNQSALQTTGCVFRAMLHHVYRLMSGQSGVPEEFTTSGADWFRANNFTALPILLIDPLALYGYGDINIVPAVCHHSTSASPCRDRACRY